ncbi:Histidinol dehydrogenase [Candidatus Methanomethylophilus alvi Mx1201]|uniref:Histidinol dehydrogenase n=4 Tax=Methanomethylophilus alvi TaxID=1291540 RepID=M9SAZ2_METAX|nr:histidinol dehydrogenase [Methanomethylophilus alvi]CDF31471.1 histidinol dehydrogenase [Methanoculleus sp. CAG:1088]AGI85486.1 Histidinol dehydrogenase [Candidatus Methanomethylophilus alvi Mx1201]AYQ54903.1 histidinol dehydrogenase [Methanomethylophilus alvi]MCI5973133.1 histidinol dehydrogenase [Methanomethylophilus alvi]MDD7480093.1 histidinol dehydrogenase [Methanomethylophilus alvi]
MAKAANDQEFVEPEKWKEIDEEYWIQNRMSKTDEVKETVEGIIEQVRKDGDKALRELTKKFDKVDVERFAVSREEIEAAYEEVDQEVVDELENAAFNIQRFHRMQLPPDMWTTEVEPGITLGVKSTPLNRVGCYIPGGLASYPSTALMTVVAAKTAGVDEVICCTPGQINPAVLVALDIAGCDEIYRVGGAQAIAAMALGTESIEKVQKIVGPGNRFVTEAKILLQDIVGIDFPAGPSEAAVLADSSAVPEFVAADLVAQGEHGPSSAFVLVTDDPSLPDKVWEQMMIQLKDEPRRDIIAQSMKNSGYIVAKDMELAIEIMNGVAPEHLCIEVKDPMDVLSKIRNAGSIFVGPYTPIAAGDYASGTNHVLPTSGYATMCSGLTVSMFRKTSTVQMLTKEGLAALAPTINTLAGVEGLHAHANSVKIRNA